MKFKEVKPGMVIHCPTEEDANALLKHLESIGYIWDDEFECKHGNSYAGWSYYGSDTCFGTGWSSKIIVWSRLQTWQKAGLAITEFSDLIEPDDYDIDITDGKIRYGGNLSQLNNLIDDSPINSPTDSPMSAVEVLEWLRKAKTKEFEKLFSCGDIEEMFDYHTNDEIIRTITAYEAAKKEKPVEVEWDDICRIIQIESNGGKKCVHEEDITGRPELVDMTVSELVESILKKYISEHEGKYFAVIENVCRVKEDK